MNKKIALYGIGGLYNYGCEAIVRGAVENIRMINPDANITYYSKFYQYDKKQIEDLNINIVNIENKSTFLKKVVSKLVDIFEIPIVPFAKKEFKKIIDENDIILSIGGDIYSIPKYKREKNKYQYVNKMVEFGEIAKASNKKLIIYGASLGPFGEYEKAKKYFINHLKKVDLIVSREKYSINYLRDNSVNENVIFLPDPAYLVGSTLKNNKLEKKYIGINLSALSIHELYGNVNDENIKRITKLIERIIDELDNEVILIPHVYSPIDKFDNDYEFLKMLHNNVDEYYKDKVKVVNPRGFIDIKNYVNNCKIVIAARMHCAVNAIIESVPTVFLSYSIKSKGMCEFIYGDLKYFIPLNEIDTKLLDIIKEISGDEKLSLDLNKRNLEILSYFNENNKDYRRLIDKLLN